MKKIGLIIRKELFRVFGDRKMIFSLYILPVVVVIVVYSLMGKLIGSMQKDVEAHKSSVVVVNANDAYKNIAASSGYEAMTDSQYISTDTYATEKDNLQNAILEGRMDLLVVLNEDFDRVYADYIAGGNQIPGMKVYFNDTEKYSSSAYAIFSQVMAEAFKSSVLEERFGDVTFLGAINIETEEIFKEEKANTEFISMMLPYMIVMLLFAGVMSVGVDAIAGEKERGTLASMLISPVKRREIAVGKLVSMGILSGISAIVYSVSMIVASHLMGGDEGGVMEGFGGISFKPLQVVQLIVVMLVLVYLYVGIVALISVLCTNTKAAASAISPVYIVIVLAGMCTMFRTGNEVSATQYMIPVYGNALTISDICANSVDTAKFFASLGATFVLGVILTIAITRAFESEKLMFNA